MKQQPVTYLKLDRPRDPRKPPRPPPDLLKCDANSTWRILPWKSCQSHRTTFTSNWRKTDGIRSRVHWL